MFEEEKTLSSSPSAPSLRCRYNLAGEGFLAVSSHPRDQPLLGSGRICRGPPLTLKTYPDRLCIYRGDKLIARHTRSYDRNQDFEDPDHPKELIAQRKKARDQKIFMRFLTLSPEAQNYYRELEKRRMNPRHHVQKIVALAEIYGAEPVARAMEDAFSFQAFSCEYIANILEQRSRALPEPGALHLTRRSDLLDLDVQQPDLSVYQKDIRPV